MSVLNSTMIMMNNTEINEMDQMAAGVASGLKAMAADSKMTGKIMSCAAMKPMVNLQE